MSRTSLRALPLVWLHCSSLTCSFCLTIYGKPFSEETLVRIAYAHEQLGGVRNQRQPIKIPSTELGDG